MTPENINHNFNKISCILQQWNKKAYLELRIFTNESNQIRETKTEVSQCPPEPYSHIT